MLLATACFIAMAAFVKILREAGLSTNQAMFWRMAPGLIWVALEMRVRGQTLRPVAAWPIVLRSLTGLGAMTCYFYALRALTLIENTVLHLLQPVFVAVLAPLILRERLRRQAVVALAVALTGAMVVIRPDRAWRSDVPVLAIAAGVGAALFSALAHMMVRKATSRDSPERVVFWFTLAVTATSLVVGLASGEFASGLPSGLELGTAAWQIAVMAGFGLAGQLLMTRAYGRAAAPKVAMVAYASIPLSILADLAWSVVPGIDAIVGSSLMILAGALLVREHSV